METAHEMFIHSPLAPISQQLQQEVLVTAVFSTNTIEGGELDEMETARIIKYA